MCERSTEIKDRFCLGEGSLELPKPLGRVSVPLHRAISSGGGGRGQRNVRPPGGDRAASHLPSMPPGQVGGAVQSQCPHPLGPCMATPATNELSDAPCHLAHRRRHCQCLQQYWRVRTMRVGCLPHLLGLAACWPPDSPPPPREALELPTHILGRAQPKVDK